MDKRKFISISFSGILTAVLAPTLKIFSFTAEGQFQLNNHQKQHPMKIQQIRNATLVVHYAGKKFLIDPMLGEKGAYPPFSNSLRQDQRNPLVELPVPVEKLLEGTDAVFITHLHSDHWDAAAKDLVPKDMKLFVQNESDKNEVESSGFNNVEILTENSVFEVVQLSKTRGQHERGDNLKGIGFVSGIVFKHPSEKTIYIAGDTIWYKDIQQEIEKHQPEVIVVNGGSNQFLDSGPLTMDKADIYGVHKAAPDSKILVSHMEAVNHHTLSRKELKAFVEEIGFSENILIPEDGEIFSF